MNSKGIVVAVVAVALIILIGGAVVLFGGDMPSTATPSTNEIPGGAATTTTPAPTPAPSSATVTYTDQGFSPASVTVAVGGKVTWTNQSAERMWVASGPHPVHTTYAGTSRTDHCPDTAGTAFDQCTAVDAGGSYTFTFTKAGTWGYHNHSHDEMRGSVTVK